MTFDLTINLDSILVLLTIAVTVWIAYRQIKAARQATKNELKRKAYESILSLMPYFLGSWGKDEKRSLEAKYHSEGKALLYMYGSPKVIRLVSELENDQKMYRYMRVIRQCREEVGELPITYNAWNVTQPNEHHDVTQRTEQPKQNLPQ